MPRVPVDRLLTDTLRSFEPQVPGIDAALAAVSADGAPAASALLRSAVIEVATRLGPGHDHDEVGVSLDSFGVMSRMERGSWVGTVHQHAIVVLAVLTLDAQGVAHVGIQQIHVGEHTLVTLLGRYAVETRRRDTAADTELQTGALLTHLGQLSGRR